MKRLLFVFVATIGLVGCGAAPSKDVNPFVRDTKAIFYTSSCTSEANGQCNEYTCTSKTNDTQPGDCTPFAAGCVKGGNHFAGTREEGKCTRVQT